MEMSIDVSRPRDEPNATGFPATLEVWDTGGIGLASMSMPGAGYTRQWAHKTRAAADHWTLLVPVRNGAGALYSERPLSFGSLGRPFTGAGDDTKVVSLFIARDLFAGSAGLFDTVSPRIADAGVVGLLADFIVALERRLGEGDGLDAAALGGALQSMLLSCLVPSRDRLQAARHPLRSALVERMMAYVRANVASPGLDQDDLCRRFTVSRTTLYRLFEETDGVAAFIRRARLDAAHAALCNPGDDSSIAAIGERFGFGDASSFSRVFRAQFGVSPRHIREAALAHEPLAQDENRAPIGLDAFLRSLRRADRAA
ncbi:helix-turn-helix domain-containing protein [Kaistia dalseonensis]|uniref:AraC-like DNA-binding protein n=1 Tax=Kaistia dalseonensis TaxID=410840 RepID=A0ABU0HDU5_9HYPH|nr:helix-turn-helix domain-containing protein [Kaistia dalseonensis]MCX5497847.1 helix-turn-helix domain-containing protein [Kaistia dalseonensis]MDQ0440491.1 AraC-like DNA-binding protein [Kaistia dalseonensis]